MTSMVSLAPAPCTLSPFEKMPETSGPMMNKGSTSHANHLADQFTHHLRVVKGLAKNTIESYSRILQGILTFLKKGASIL